MRCRQIQERLDAYLTEDHATLPEGVRGQIRVHLQSCAECRREWSKRQALYRLLAEATAPAVPEGFASRVAARAGVSCELIPLDGLPARSEPNRWRRLRQTAGVAAALATGLALGAFLGNGVWQEGSEQGMTATAREADILAAAGFGRLVVDEDDSLARAYLGLISGRDG